MYGPATVESTPVLPKAYPFVFQCSNWHNTLSTMTSRTKLTFCLLACAIISVNTSVAQSDLTAGEKSRVDSLQQRIDSLSQEKTRLYGEVSRTVSLTGDVTLRSSPSPVGDEIMEVQSGTSVEVLKGDGNNNSYVFISHGENEGWVHKNSAFGSKTVMPNRVFHLENQIESLKRRISSIKTPTCREKLGGGEKAAFACSGSVVPGMTKRMVREAWGDPKDINTTVTERTRREQWVYGSLRNSNRRYVYFEKGVVTTIQR